MLQTFGDRAVATAASLRRSVAIRSLLRGSDLSACNERTHEDLLLTSAVLVVVNYLLFSRLLVV